MSAGPTSGPLGDRPCCLRNAAAEIVRGAPGLPPPPALFNDDVELAMRGAENGGVGRGYSGGGERYVGGVDLGDAGAFTSPPTAVAVPVEIVGVGVGSGDGRLSIDAVS